MLRHSLPSWVTTSLIRVLIADNQAIVRQGLEVILRYEADLVVIGFATNCEDLNVGFGVGFAA